MLPFPKLLGMISGLGDLNSLDAFLNWIFCDLLPVISSLSDLNFPDWMVVYMFLVVYLWLIAIEFFFVFIP